MTAMVEVRGLTKNFGKLPILCNINFDVSRNEVVAIIGPSGSGKSTLLRCLNFLEAPNAGTIRIDGHLLGYRDEPDGRRVRLGEPNLNRQRAEIGMVFQQFNLWPHRCAGIEAVPRAHVHAARSLGMSHMQTLRRVVIPQAMVLVLPPLTTEVISQGKATALISTIAIGELLRASYLQLMHRFSEGVVGGSLAHATSIGSLLIGPGTAAGPLATTLAATGGRLLFEGRVDVTQWRSMELYQFREFDYHMVGVARDAGSILRIWVKNEHHMVWRYDILIASSPDPIIVLNAESLEPLTTLGDVRPQLAVLVVAVPVSTSRISDGISGGF